MLNRDHFAGLGLAGVRDKVLAGERLSFEDGERLFACPDPTAVGALAHHVRTRLHGTKAHFVVNRHVNYTNVCVNGCSFCAYQRRAGEEGGFTLSAEQAVAKLADAPLTPAEVHVVGGCHPDLPFDYCEGLVRAVREFLPQASLKCFTAVEIAHFARLAGLTEAEVLVRLKAAGLDMLPGGGAEIFAPEIRERICPKKISGEHWLSVHETAHGLGIKTNATMLFGHLESPAHRLDHLLRLRDLQDRTGGFVCFIPLPFQTENSRLRGVRPLTGTEELTTVAVSRLMLDNVPHLKAYWVMLGVKTAQAALHFGADDLDGTVVEEKIGHSAGASSEQALTRAELRDMIRGCGLSPVERDGLFREVRP